MLLTVNIEKNKLCTLLRNFIFLKLMHVCLDSPVCATQQERYGALVGETILIRCTVLANPHVERFRWWHQDMGKRREFPQHEIAVFPQRNYSYSVLNFT